MKNGKKLIAGMVACLLLNGCGAQIPELTQEQTDKVVQYAAGILLKYDRNYDSGIMSEEEMAAQIRKQITPTPTPVPEKNAEDPGQTEQENEVSEDLIGTKEDLVDHRTIAEFLSLNGVDISYTGYDIAASYPENETDEWYFAMDAVEGDQLLIIKFRVTNISQETMTVDILNLAPRFRAFIAGGPQINAATTLLTDDLKTLQTTLQPAESVDEVVVVEITDQEAQSLQNGASLDLAVRLSSDTLKIRLEEGNTQ